MALNSREHFIANSLCQYFGGSYRLGEDPPDFYLIKGGKEFAVEASSIVQYIHDNNGTMVPRNSQDIGVVRIGDEFNIEFCRFIKNDECIILTLFSPVYQLRNFKVELKKSVENFINSDDIIRKVKVCGNSVRMKRYTNCYGKKPISCVVANSRSSPYISENARFSLVRILSQKAKKCRNIKFDNIWLCLFNEYFLADIECFHQAMNNIDFEHPFNKIIIVSHEGFIDEIY